MHVCLNFFVKKTARNYQKEVSEIRVEDRLKCTDEDPGHCATTGMKQQVTRGLNVLDSSRLNMKSDAQIVETDTSFQLSTK